jgi:hypothetical protein
MQVYRGSGGRQPEQEKPEGLGPLELDVSVYLKPFHGTVAAMKILESGIRLLAPFIPIVKVSRLGVGA